MLEHKYTFEAIGTQWSIETDSEISAALKLIIQDRINVFDTTYSRFRDDSLITRIKERAGTYKFPPDARKLFDFYKILYDRTDGKVTPLIGDMLERAGYDADYSLTPRPLQSVPNWQAVMQWGDDSSLITQRPLTLDVGAVGKGYLVDIVAAILDENKKREYVIDASGDLRHVGTSDNRVGLEHPFDVKKVIGAVQVQNKSLCASASNRRSWGKDLHHIFDPTKMAPVRDVIATWVIADETMVADGLCTALFFVDPQTFSDFYDYQYVRMYANGAIDYSPGFKGELF